MATLDEVTSKQEVKDDIKGAKKNKRRKTLLTGLPSVFMLSIITLLLHLCCEVSHSNVAKVSLSVRQKHDSVIDQ